VFRVFPPAARTEGDAAPAPLHAPPAPPPDAAAAATDALVAELRGVIADLRQDRDHWREQAQRLALPAPPSPEPRQSWLRWWFGWQAGGQVSDDRGFSLSFGRLGARWHSHRRRNLVCDDLAHDEVASACCPPCGGAQ
jgi:hypothetical protein